MAVWFIVFHMTIMPSYEQGQDSIMTDNRRKERLRFRSWHRGTREMDLLMGSFADSHLPDFTDAQLDAYESLMGFSDPDLYNWITAQEPVPVEHKSDVMEMLITHRYKK